MESTKNTPSSGLSDLVCKANALIEARYRLTTAEHRVLLSCIAQIRRDDENLSDEVLYSVSALEIAESAGVSRQAAYKDLKEAADRLFERYISIPYGPNGEAVTQRKFRWVQEIVYRANEGQVQLRFSKAILPYLNQLKRQFTTYNLRDVIKMTSSHAIRLYEIIVQWRQTGERTVEIEWLKQALQIEDKYSSIRDLKRYVIDIAVEQINERSPLRLEWEQIKVGRRVTSIRFKFGPKESGKLAAPSAPPLKGQNSHATPTRGALSQAEIARRARPGESWDDARTRLMRERDRQYPALKGGEDVKRPL